MTGDSKESKFLEHIVFMSRENWEFKLLQVSIESMLGSSLVHVGTMFQAARDNIGAMLIACLGVHVRSFLVEVCKHIQSAECSLRET